MESKFTIKDILVFFTTGSAVIFLLYLDGMKAIDVPDFVKENFTPVTIIAVPLIYLVGHIVDSIDLIRLKIADIARPKDDGKTFKKKLSKVIYSILARDRISGVLFFECESEEEYQNKFRSFWKKVNYIQISEKAGHNEYFDVLKDLFGAMQSVAILGLALSLIGGFNDYLFFSMLVLLPIFWLRSAYYARCYIDSVDNIYDILKKEG